jgi:hypothetical protein
MAERAPDISGVIAAWQSAMVDFSEPWVSRLAVLLSEAVEERRLRGEVTVGGLRQVVETVCAEVGVHDTLVPLQRRLLEAVYEHFPEVPIDNDDELLLGGSMWSHPELLAEALLSTDQDGEPGPEAAPSSTVRAWEMQEGETMTQLAQKIRVLEHACRRIRREAALASIRAAAQVHRLAGLVKTPES